MATDTVENVAGTMEKEENVATKGEATLNRGETDATEQDDSELVDRLRQELIKRKDENGWDVTDKQKKEVEFFLTTDNLRRYLVARGHHYEKALKMAAASLEWRSKNCPMSLTVADFPTANSQGVWRCMGYAKDGSPILMVRIRLWQPSQYSVEEYVKCVAYYMEENRRRMKDAVNDRHFLLVDSQKVSYFSIDFRHVVASSKLMSDYYPEQLGMVFVANADMVTTMVWQVIQSVIDERTASKVVISRKNYEERLDELVGLENVFSDLSGGTRAEDWPMHTGEERTKGEESAEAES